MPIAPNQIHIRMQDFLRRTGLSYDELAHLLDFKRASSVQRYIQEERHAYLKLDLVQQLANKLVGMGSPPIEEWEVLELGGPLIVNYTSDSKNAALRQIDVAPPNLSSYGSHDLPVRGRWNASGDAYDFDAEEAPLAFVVRPMELSGVRDAYAVYIYGTANEPAFMDGCLAHVDPHRPATIGNDVIVQLLDGRGFLGRLTHRTPRTVTCQQYSGETFEFPAKDVRSIHLVTSATRVRA